MGTVTKISKHLKKKSLACFVPISEYEGKSVYRIYLMSGLPGSGEITDAMAFAGKVFFIRGGKVYWHDLSTDVCGKVEV